MSWDEKWVSLAQHYATWSKDPSTKVGCVLVHPESMAQIAQGYNGFPRGVREHDHEQLFDEHYRLLPELAPERWARPTKYNYCEHAERNAIYNAARLGHATNGCWAYLSWDPNEICAPCARALIQAGIVRIAGPRMPLQGRLDIGDDGGWRASCELGRQMFKETGVEVQIV